MGTTGKMVYENWTVQRFDYHILVQENHNARAVFGMDFEYVSDAITFVCSLVDVANRSCIFDKMFEHGLQNNQIIEKVKAKGYAKEFITVDIVKQNSITGVAYELILI